LCTLDDSRYFLRGCLPLYFTDREGRFTWGAWAEVSHDDHNFYVGQVLNETFKGRRLAGRIANAIPGYRSTLNLQVHVLLERKGSDPLASTDIPT
jgi:hypothetical protein